MSKAADGLVEATNREVARAHIKILETEYEMSDRDVRTTEYIARCNRHEPNPTLREGLEKQRVRLDQAKREFEEKFGEKYDKPKPWWRFLGN